jgi:hypothetical protein
LILQFRFRQTYFGLKYYENAIEVIKSKAVSPYFFVFTDDMVWAKANLLVENIYFVEGNEKNKSHIDMYLMSICKHNIVANSTFSWWGAWLNKNANKIVVSPIKWLTTKRQKDGLAIKEWIYL